MLVIGFSYAKFVKMDVSGNKAKNTIMGNTISGSEITEGFIATYDEGDNFIDTEEIAPSYQDIRKFKVATDYNAEQYITIWLMSAVNTSGGNYALYNCNEANYTNATYSNVASNCTKISAASDTLPSAGITKQIHTAAKLTLAAKGTNYYVLTTNTISSSYTFKGVVLVKKYTPTLAEAILESYSPVSDTISSTYVSSASGINFSEISRPTNGQGLYINNKANVAGDPTVGTIKYFRGGTFCYIAGDYVPRNEESCTSLGGTWNSTNYTCSINTSQSICQAAGGTFYELKNNVMFAGFAWRVTRINADGSVRMIYNGTSTIATGVETILSGAYVAYNSVYEDNAYVGYMFGTPNSATYALTHANNNNSTIKTTVDNWYVSNLTSYANKLTTAGFCGDRVLSSGTGIKLVTTFYAPQVRTATNKTPTFNCPQTNDIYTLTTASVGNKKLTYPIALLSVDDAVYAGSIYFGTQNFGFYLGNSNFWLMGASALYSEKAYAFYLQHGFLADELAPRAYQFGARPVIDLKADIKVSSGTGTLTDPWIIS